MAGDPAPPVRISILRVEDHPVFRDGLSMIIGAQGDMRLVAQAATADEALAAFRRHRPDITLMDLRLPNADGIDALVAIRNEFPSARVIILSTSDSDGDISRALKSGAAGYLLKSDRVGLPQSLPVHACRCMPMRSIRARKCGKNNGPAWGPLNSNPAVPTV